MKFLSYITLFAAFAFGMNNTNAVATPTNDNSVVVMDGGKVSASFNEATETITLRMVSASAKESVIIILTGSDGTVVYKEKAVVNNRGTVLEIPMADLKEGNYLLSVKGTSLNYSNRFKKK